MLKEGDKAPNFRATADDGSTVSLADFSGHNLVLYFYPKANTTRLHAAKRFEFRDMHGAISRRPTRRSSACSGDSVAAQAKFKEKYDLNFPLLADTKFDVIEAYGARRMKSFFGKSALGIVRMSFWIGPDGKIRKIWPKVTVKGHAAEVLETIKAGTAPAGAFGYTVTRKRIAHAAR